MEKEFLTPKECGQATVNVGVMKSQLCVWRMILLGFLAGVFIAFGGFASQMISHSIDSTGVAKFAGAAVFPVGLMLVVMAGAELFTGNNLMTMALFEKKIGFGRLLKNWFFVYISNLVGSVLFAWTIYGTGLLNTSGGKLGAVAINTAFQKIQIGFGPAFLRAILCNILVVLAVWLAASANDIIGKIGAIWFPIMLFVLSGFEHSIANMYFIPAGILASGQEAFLQIQGLDISGLTWGAFFIRNLLPVTIGNILGGSLFVGATYWLTYRKLI